MLRYARLVLFIALMASIFSSQATASVITMADAGGLDKFLASTDLKNSGDAEEESWVESVLGYDVTISDKYDSEGSDWQLVSDSDDVYASRLSGTPDYFLLKLGTGGTSLQSHYLFENIGDLSWAAVDFSDAGIDLTMKRVNVGRISHLGEFGSITTTEIEVPEPETLFMFTLGLVAFFARKLKPKV